MTQKRERERVDILSISFSRSTTGQKGKSRVGAAGLFVRDIEFPRVRYTASIVRTNICLAVVAGDQVECVSGIRRKIMREKKHGGYLENIVRSVEA